MTDNQQQMVRDMVVQQNGAWGPDTSESVDLASSWTVSDVQPTAKETRPPSSFQGNAQGVDDVAEHTVENRPERNDEVYKEESKKRPKKKRKNRPEEADQEQPGATRNKDNLFENLEHQLAILNQHGKKMNRAIAETSQAATCSKPPTEEISHSGPG